MSGSLDAEAYAIAEEVREGKWDHALRLVPNGQPAASEDVISELRRRCPGYSKEQYQEAIAKGMKDSLF
jgi:hypothetical protein